MSKNRVIVNLLLKIQNQTAPLPEIIAQGLLKSIEMSNKIDCFLHNPHPFLSACQNSPASS